MRLPSSALGALEIALTRYLQQDTRALERCAKLAGAVLRLRIPELDLAFELCPDASGVRVAQAGETEPTATVSGSLPSLLRAWLRSGEGAAAARELEISGDAEFAQDLLNILREADFDLDEWLSRHVGDVTAHRLGQFLRGAAGYGKRVAETLTLDTAEYLREETRDLVHAEEVAQWGVDVDRLREATDRLEARLKRLLAE